MINPFMLLAAKTKLQPEEVIDIDLRNMIWLDLLKSNKADDNVCGQITRNLVITQIIAADKQSRALYDMSCIGIKAFMTAMIRNDERNMPFMELSTPELKAVKKVLLSYGRVLPQLDLGSIKGAADRWLEIKANFGGGMMNKNSPQYPLCDMVNNTDSWEECVNSRYYAGWRWVEVDNGFALKHDRFMSVTRSDFLRFKAFLNIIRSEENE